MTWKESTWFLQWGAPAGGVVAEVVHPGPNGKNQPLLSFHYPGGTPLWVVVKGELYLRQWLRTPPGGGPRPGRWITQTVRGFPPRWAEKGVPHPGGVNWGVRGVGSVFRPPGGFDFSRWKFTLRGTYPAGWSTLVDPEVYLLRPRYV